MDLKELLDRHQEIVFKKKGQAVMVLAYHSLGQGICFGGIRLSPPHSEEKAIKDALRLSEAMTYKLAMINEHYGGCKAAVLMPKTGMTKKFLHNIGELIQEENGKFISAIDFGFEPDDAKIIREKTKYILAIKDSKFGQSGVTTAYGVLAGIKCSLQKIYGSETIKGRTFAIQGLGSVGQILTQELTKAGGNVYISDLDKKRLDRFKGQATIVSPDKLLFLNVDVLCPCGPAYVINKNTIPKLNCKIIAGGANCQLEDEVHDDHQLYKKKILVAPDYVINAGGVIQGIEELKNGSLKKARARLPIIVKNLKQIYKISKINRKGTYVVAQKMAIERMKKLAKN